MARVYGTRGRKPDVGSSPTGGTLSANHVCTLMVDSRWSSDGLRGSCPFARAVAFTFTRASKCRHRPYGRTYTLKPRLYRAIDEKSSSVCVYPRSSAEIERDPAKVEAGGSNPLGDTTGRNSVW